MLVECPQALFRRGVEHLEELGEVHAEVGAVLGGAQFEVFLKLASLEKGGVLGEHTEEQPDQEDFQGMPIVAGGLELVVQPAELFGSLDVDRVLLSEAARLVAGDEAEEVDAAGEFGEGEFHHPRPVGHPLLIQEGAGGWFEVVESETGEVGDEDVARQVALLQAGKVVEGLAGGAIQVLAARLVLDQQDPFPEQVDKPAVAISLFDRALERSDAAPGDAEDVEEAVPEALGLGVLGRLVGPLAGKGEGAVADFVPGKRHGRAPVKMLFSTMAGVGCHGETNAQAIAPLPAAPIRKNPAHIEAGSLCQQPNSSAARLRTIRRLPAGWRMPDKAPWEGGQVRVRVKLGAVILFHISSKMALTYVIVLFTMHFMLFTIGQQIRTERKRRKLSQADLAELLGMSRTTISQIENGTVQDIGVRKLIRIVEVLGLELRVRSAGAPPTLDELREEET